jgi:Zn-dependent protease/CBS domain-containing protein
MRGFRIGRIFGIDLRVDWSWIFIFVLVTWGLVDLFSRWHPDWPPIASAAVAMSASLLFFGGVVLHELAHSLVAMSYGVRVRSITLFLFGGVSKIEREPASAKAEFFIAIAGPITSLGLGIAASALASLAIATPIGSPEDALAALSRLGPVGTLLAWLGPVNITIGVFNLIPGFPLDGGRVLRAILWSATGDFRAATRWAAGAGQVVGWLFVGVGVAMAFGVHVPPFGTGLTSGLWLALIGWFLRSAATQTSARLAIDDALAGMTVAQLMQRQGASVSPEESVATLVHQYLVPGDDRALPVVRDGWLVGLVSVSNVRGVAPERWAFTPVSAVMRDRDALQTATPNESLGEAFGELAARDIEQLPVVVDGRLVGMLRRRDIARWLELAWRPPRAASGFTRANA